MSDLFVNAMAAHIAALSIDDNSRQKYVSLTSM